MPFDFPDFSDPILDELHLCGSVPDEELFAQYEDSPFLTHCEYGNGHGIRISIGVWEKPPIPDGNVVHLHLDFRRSYGIKRSASRSEKKLAEVFAKLDAFVGKLGVFHVTGEFLIPKEQRPSTGVVPAMLGISMATGAERLTVSGARLQYSGAEWDEVEWRIKPDESLNVVIDAFSTFSLSGKAIADAAKLIRDGLDRMVLDQQENAIEPAG